MKYSATLALIVIVGLVTSSTALPARKSGTFAKSEKSTPEAYSAENDAQQPVEVEQLKIEEELSTADDESLASDEAATDDDAPDLEPRASLPEGTFFPFSFGGTNGDAIAISNSVITGGGGSAISHAIAYGSPDDERARVNAVEHHEIDANDDLIKCGSC